MRTISGKWNLVFCAVLCVAAAGCHTFGKKDKARAEGAPAAESAAAVAPSESALEAELRQAVANDIAAADKNAKDTIERRRPYFFKEYGEYPAPQEIDVTMESKESRIIPYEAEVTVPKLRYATKLHRERETAAADDHFFRGTGKETLTYQYRGGHWLRAGSLFVADKVEENVNGEWLPVVENLETTIAAEEQKSEGWLGRAWSSITGR